MGSSQAQAAHGLSNALRTAYTLSDGFEGLIRSFKDRQTRRFFEGSRIARFHQFREQAGRRLTVLENAETLQDLAGLPGNRLESLSGDRSGCHSIRINQQWRICFRWEDDGPYDVEIVDYH